MKFVDDIKNSVNKKIIMEFSNNFNRATPEQKIMILSQMAEKTATETTEQLVKFLKGNGVIIGNDLIKEWYNNK
jgi:hypothetical protein